MVIGRCPLHEEVNCPLWEPCPRLPATEVARARLASPGPLAARLPPVPVMAATKALRAGLEHIMKVTTVCRQLSVCRLNNA